MWDYTLKLAKCAQARLEVEVVRFRTKCSDRSYSFGVKQQEQSREEEVCRVPGSAVAA